VQNPELSAKERKALEILKREEENAQGDLFAPSEKSLPKRRLFALPPTISSSALFIARLRRKFTNMKTPCRSKSFVAERSIALKKLDIAKPHEVGISRRRSITKLAAYLGGQRTYPRASALSEFRFTI